MKRAIFWGLFFVFSFVTQTAVAEPVKVFVSILPQKYFLEKIGGNLVDVSVMVKPGVSPATYEPKPRQMVALAKAKSYFAIGVPFEAAWLDKIARTHRDMLIVHTETGIDKLPMMAHRHHEEGRQQNLEKDVHHYNEGEHDHKEHHQRVRDPHVWLSPPLVMQQARNIFEALVALDPVNLSIYQANYRKFIVELVDLDLELKTLFHRSGEHSEFMVFHPSWGYFARAYGLEQVPIEIEGKEPKPAELKYLIQYARDRGIKVVFVQPQFSWQAAQTIAQSIGGRVVFVDPLAFDWASNLRQVALKFKGALR